MRGTPEKIFSGGKGALAPRLRKGGEIFRPPKYLVPQLIANSRYLRRFARFAVFCGAATSVGDKGDDRERPQKNVT
jgi:hypothetical protein